MCRRMNGSGDPAGASRQPRHAGAVVSALFFLSGCGALVFETLWFRQSGLAFGNSVWATTLVLASFMGGLALGNALAARHAWRFAKPLSVYAGIEIAVAATGIALVWSLPRLGSALAPLLRVLEDQPVLLNLVRLALSFVLLLLPTTCMGATLAVVVKALFSRDGRFGPVLGRLYGWNTLGAVVGAVAVEIILLPALGVMGTGLFAGALDIVAAVVALGLERGWVPPASPQPLPDSARSPAFPSGVMPLLAAAFLGGAILLALEVVWFRFVLLFVFGNSLAFAAMLAVVLIGIGLGGLAAGRWTRISPEAWRHGPVVALMSGVLVVICYAGFDSGAKLESFSQIVLICASLMLPVCFLSGVLFTFVGNAVFAALGTAPRATALLTLANTTGAMIGAFVASVLLLPGPGLQTSFFLLATGYGLVAALLLWRSAPHRALYGAAAAFVAALALFPWGRMHERFLPDSIAEFQQEDVTVVAIREGQAETIQLLRTDLLDAPLRFRLTTNGYSMTGTSVHARRYMKLFALLPAAIHPDPKRALLISYGTGSTARALADLQTLKSIDIVDISADILTMSDFVYPHRAQNPLHDPRVRTHIEDGRYFLEMTDGGFDIITGEPPPPKQAGIGNLYSLEYFRLMRARLNHGGIASYWLPLHDLAMSDSLAIIRAFCTVFSDCSLWNGSDLDLLLIGSREAQGGVSADHFSRFWRDPTWADELEAIGIESPQQLGSMFIGDAPWLQALSAKTDPLTDNWPHRLSTPFPDGEELRRYAPWFDAAAARQRFTDSALVARLWPREIRAATLDLFATQERINDFYLERGNRLDTLESLLTKSSVKAPLLWLMRSSRDHLAIVRRAAASGKDGFVVRYHLAADALSNRDYSAAAKRFASALKARPDALQMHDWILLSLVLDGQAQQAQAHAAELENKGELDSNRLATLRWLARRTGLPGLKVRPTPRGYGRRTSP